MPRLRILLSTTAAATFLACAHQPDLPPAQAPATVAKVVRAESSGPCARADAMLSDARDLATQGRVERALDRMQAALGVCPPREPMMCPSLLGLMADTGKWPEAAAAIARWDAQAGLPAPCRQAIEAARPIVAQRRVFPPSAVSQRSWDSGWQAMRARLEGKPADARRLAQASLEDWPDNPWALVVQGLDASDRGDPAAARRTLDHALVSLERWTGARARGVIPAEGASLHFSWSPDDKTVVRYGTREVRFHHAVSGVELGAMDFDKDGQRARVGFSPDSRQAAIADGNGLRIWDLASQRVISTPRTGMWVSDAAFSPDGSQVAATLGFLQRVELHEPATGKLLRRLETGRADQIWWQSASRLVLSGGHVTVRDASTGELLWDAGGCGGNSAVSADGRWWACATDLGVRMTDLVSFAHGAFVSLPSERSTYVALSGRGSVLAASAIVPGPGVRQVFQLFTLPGGHARAVLPEALFYAEPSLSYDGSRALVYHSRDTVSVWDTQTGLVTLRWPAPAKITALAGVADTLFLGDQKGHLRAISRRQAAVPTLEGHTDKIVSLTVSHDGTRLASVGSDGAARLWDVRSGAQVGLVPANAPAVAVAFDSQGSRLAVARDDNAIAIYDTALNQEAMIASAGHVESLAWLGQESLAVGTYGELRVLDLKGAAPPRVFAHKGLGVKVHLDASGGSLLSVAGGRSGSEARLWRVRQGGLEQAWQVNTNSSVATLSPDGRWVALGASQYVMVFDTNAGQPLGELEPPAYSGFVEALHALDGGRTLLAAYSDGTLAWWSIPEGKLLARGAMASEQPALAVTANDGTVSLLGSIPAARRLLRCQVGSFSVPFEACEDRLTNISPGGSSSWRSR